MEKQRLLLLFFLWSEFSRERSILLLLLILFLQNCILKVYFVELSVLCFQKYRCIVQTTIDWFVLVLSFVRSRAGAFTKEAKQNETLEQFPFGILFVLSSERKPEALQVQVRGKHPPTTTTTSSLLSSTRHEQEKKRRERNGWIIQANKRPKRASEQVENP